MKPNLLFDLDGTLTDPKEGILRCIQHALAKGGRPVPPMSELVWCIGPPLHVSLAQLAPDASEEEVWRLVGFYRERFGTVGMFENGVYPGIPDLLAKIHPGHRVFTATSKPEFFAKQILDHFRLSQYFHRVYGSELDGTRSEKVDLIRHILAEQGLRAEDTVIIGDRKHDVIGAQKAGITSVGILWGYGTRAELEEAGADFIATDLASLERLLLG